MGARILYNRGVQIYRKGIFTMKHKLTILLSLLLSASLLASCAGDGREEEKSTEIQTIQSTEKPDITETEAKDETEAETAAPIPEDAINVVTDWGLQADAGAGKANSLLLIAKMTALPDGSTVYFPEGEYELLFPMYLLAKKDIRLVGDNVTLIRTGVDNESALSEPMTDSDIPEDIRYLTASSAFFVSLGTEGLVIEGFRFVYELPTSLSGKVLSVSGGVAEIELTDGETVTGREYVTVVTTFDGAGIADKRFEQYAETNFPLEKLSDNRVRISGLDIGGAAKLSPGTRVCLRLCSQKEYVIMVGESTNVVLRDLHLQSSFNGGILVAERCENLTLQNVTVRSDNDKALMSLNADGLHIAGLAGELTVENCKMERAGDDFINVHCNAYTVNAVNGKTLEMASPRFGFGTGWAKVGDRVVFYDGQNFEKIGEAVITELDNGKFGFDALPEGVKVGCVVANKTTLPSVRIRSNEFGYTRARGVLIQSEDVEIKDNSFYGTALAAILLAPDLENWFELSAAANVLIEGNRFEKCGSHGAGVIQVTASHDSDTKSYESYIHSEITVKKNSFARLGSPSLYGLCIEGLRFADNEIDGAGYDKAYVKLKHCKNVSVEDVEEGRVETEDLEN